MARKNMITAVFQDRFDAQRALDDLYSHGYESSEISVMMSDTTRAAFHAEGRDLEKHDTGNLATEGMGVGGAIGTAVGASLGAIAMIGASVAFPLLGFTLWVAGPIAGALAGGGAGAVTGGLIGTLVGAGMSESNAEAYTSALKNGGVVIGVVPHNDEESKRIQDRFKEFKGENVFCC